MRRWKMAGESKMAGEKMQRALKMLKNTCKNCDFRSFITHFTQSMRKCS